MISVLIPTYRFDPTVLVNELHRQLTVTGLSFEICIADDAPDSPLSNEYQDLCHSLHHVRASIREVNLGAFENRRRLAEDAVYDRLLYLDEDAIIDATFIQRYTTHFKEKGNVVQGGARFAKEKPSNKTHHLRWKVGKQRESSHADKRQSNPYAGFITCNFIIDKHVLLKLPRHKEIKGYGHEDTMMGYDLKYAFVPIVHIDNPIGHLQMDDAETYLIKTRKGVANLARLIKAGKVDEDIRLYRFYKKIKKTGSGKLLATYVYNNNDAIVRKLSKENPPLRLFDLYKMGWLFYEVNQKNGLKQTTV
ncbi:MAG: glycosyltransferase [Cryomorphaceae bacterium]|nr:glycosyltransferase [Cryomorphaceae bacterium]